MNRVLVTGGNGLIGSEISNLFQQNGYSVSISDLDVDYCKIDSNLRSRLYDLRCKRSSGIPVHSGDLTKTENSKSLFEEVQPQIIVHSANLPLPGIAETDHLSAQANIFEITDNILNLMPPSTEKFIYISSSLVYGDQQSEWVTENSRPNPLGEYAKSKLEAEKLVEKICTQKNIEFAIARPMAVFGEFDTNARFISKLFDCGFRNESFNVSSGGASYCPTHVEDFAHGILQLAKSQNGVGVFNFSGPEVTTIAKIAEKVKAKFFPEMDLTLSELDTTSRSPLSIEKAKKVISYDPKIGVDEGLNRMFEVLKTVYMEAGVIDDK